MKRLILAACCILPVLAPAALRLDEEVLGEKLGGWNAKGRKASEYAITGVKFRTWKPHVTPTADGGLFVSVRIDHLRGLLASDDHASLELQFDKDGEIRTAHSTIALQGRKITSDVIRGTAEAGATATTADRMVKMGTDLVADLTAKLLREKVSEPGRVGFPAALQHNYHLVCLAVQKVDRKAVVVDSEEGASDSGEGPNEAPAPPATELPAGESPAEEAPAEEAPAGEAPAPSGEGERVVPPLEIEVHGRPGGEKPRPLPVPAR